MTRDVTFFNSFWAFHFPLMSMESVVSSEFLTFHCSHCYRGFYLSPVLHTRADTVQAICVCVSEAAWHSHG